MALILSDILSVHMIVQPLSRFKTYIKHPETELNNCVEFKNFVRLYQLSTIINCNLQKCCFFSYYGRCIL